MAEGSYPTVSKTDRVLQDLQWLQVMREITLIVI